MISDRGGNANYRPEYTMQWIYEAIQKHDYLHVLVVDLFQYVFQTGIITKSKRIAFWRR